MSQASNSLNYEAITSAVEVEIERYVAEAIRRQDPKGNAFCKAVGALLFWRSLVGQLDLANDAAATFEADSKRLEAFVFNPPQRSEWMIGTSAVRKQNMARNV